MQSLKINLDDDVLFIVVTALLGLMSVFLTGVFVLGLLIAVRYSIAFVFYPRERGHGEIMRKKFTASYVGYTGMMYPVQIPARYDLQINIKGKESVKTVKYELFNAVKRGDGVNVVYAIEPFTRKLYIWKIWQ